MTAPAKTKPAGGSRRSPAAPPAASASAVAHVRRAASREIGLRRAAEENVLQTDLVGLIYDSVTDILYLLAVEPSDVYRFESVNRAFLTATGMTPEQVIGRRVEEVLPESSHALVLGNYRRAIEEKRRVDWEEVAVYPTGTKVGAVNISPMFDAAGRCKHLIGTVHDVTEQRRSDEAIASSERRYAVIFEGTTEAILIVELATQRVRWANPAACTLFGYPSEEFTERSIGDLVPADALATALAGVRNLSAGRQVVVSTPVMQKDGTRIVADVKVSLTEIDGAPCIVAFLYDATERNRLEVRARQFAQAIDDASDAILLTGPSAEVEYVNPAFEALSGLRSDELLGGNPSALGSPQSSAMFDEMWQSLSSGASWIGDLVHRHPDGTERVAEASISPVVADDGTATGYVAVERDVTDARAAQAERMRLATAVDQASDSVIVTDLAGTIEYVNPAFERMSGYARHEALGKNPRILKSDRQASPFYEALWRRLGRGETWSGRMTNRRANGDLYQVEATISPIRDPAGEPTGYLGIQRDVTALLAARSTLANEFRERAQVAAALFRLQPRESAEQTARSICDELAGLPGVDVAAIFTFQGPGRGITLAVTGPDGLPVAPGRPLPATRAAYLYERASQGPWAEAWRTRPEDRAYGRQLADLGLKATAYAPIRNGEGLLGLVLAGTFDETFASHLIGHLPIVGEFAATASALLAGQVEQGRRTDVVRARIKAILATRAFHPVFQPVVELDSGRIAGHEALTRFADGTRPDDVFADAHAVGIGLELEFACLAAAIEASDVLPPDAWLGLNVSPDAILAPARLAELVAGQPRQIVLEITEHAAIADYAAVRAAATTLGPTVSLSVDDAGAGFASLHHVVELAPRFLKIDISLVRGVDHDPTRQAMIAGLTHFAGRTACVVIAEGIEEPAELAMLRELGVPLGQGYLLGQPEPTPATSVTGRSAQVRP